MILGLQQLSLAGRVKVQVPVADSTLESGEHERRGDVFHSTAEVPLSKTSNPHTCMSGICGPTAVEELDTIGQQNELYWHELKLSWLPDMIMWKTAVKSRLCTYVIDVCLFLY